MMAYFDIPIRIFKAYWLEWYFARCAIFWEFLIFLGFMCFIERMGS